MFSFITSYFERESFVYKSQFSIPSYLHNYYNIVVGITKSGNVGIQINKSEEMNSAIYILNYVLKDKCNNNELIYYFGNNNDKIRLKFYIKNNVETFMKEFYYHLFYVEENIDIHCKIEDYERNILDYRQLKYDNELRYLVYFLNQEDKIIENNIPFFERYDKKEEIKEYKKEINLI